MTERCLGTPGCGAHKNTVPFEGATADSVGAHVCLIAYATVIEYAARQLADGARVSEDKFSGARVFALPELSKQASYAFWDAMADRKVSDEIDARYNDLKRAVELLSFPKTHRVHSASHSGYAARRS